MASYLAQHIDIRVDEPAALATLSRGHYVLRRLLLRKVVNPDGHECDPLWLEFHRLAPTVTARRPRDSPGGSCRGFLRRYRKARIIIGILELYGQGEPPGLVISPQGVYPSRPRPKLATCECSVNKDVRKL